MAKNGTKIEELYMSLGLDLSEFDADLAMADKTVSQGMDALDRKKRNIRLKAEIDTNSLTGADSITKALEIKERALNQQLALQKQRVDLLNAAYQKEVEGKGAAAIASQRLETRLLKEKAAYSQLEAEIRRTAAEQVKANTVPATSGSILSGALSKAQYAKDGVSSVMGGVGAIAGKAGAALAFVEAAGGLMDVTKGAMEAGDNVYKLSQRMHITTGEAAKMNAMFKLAGVDAKEAAPGLTRLDRAILSAGANGNDTTNALKRFGVSLTDGSGKLLPMNEQLRALAQGYKRASESGQEEAFAAEVLGRNGQALIPVLADMDDLLEATADIETTGLLNPDDCHELSISWKKMQAESNQLKMAVGAALIPVAAEIMPDLIELVKDLVSGIKDNKDNIKYLADAFVMLAKYAGNNIKYVLGLLDDVGINAKNIKTAIESVIFSVETLAKAKEQLKAGDFAGVSYTIDNADFDTWKQQREEEKKAAEEAKKAAEDAKKAKQEQNRTTMDVTASTKEEEAAAKKAAEAEKKAAEEAAKANDELAAKIYELGHNQLENSLHKVDLDSEKYRQRGADEARITEAAEAEKAKIRLDFENNVQSKIDAVWKTDLQNKIDSIDRERQAYIQKGADEVQAEAWAAEEKARVQLEFENTVVSKIDSVWRSELLNRLHDIEVEKQAYIQKGIDEVKASEWAEHEKRMAQQKEALAAFKENRVYLDILRNAMAGEGTMEEKMAKAREAMLIAMRQKYEITGFDRTTPWEMNTLSYLMGDVKQNLVPGLEVSDWAKTMGSQSIPVYRGTQVSQEVPGVTVNVYADFKDSYVDSEEAQNRFINKMGKRMAPQVAQAVSQKLGGGFNSY